MWDHGLTRGWEERDPTQGESEVIGFQYNYLYVGHALSLTFSLYFLGKVFRVSVFSCSCTRHLNCECLVSYMEASHSLLHSGKVCLFSYDRRSWATARTLLLQVADKELAGSSRTGPEKQARAALDQAEHKLNPSCWMPLFIASTPTDGFLHGGLRSLLSSPVSTVSLSKSGEKWRSGL